MRTMLAALTLSIFFPTVAGAESLTFVPDPGLYWAIPNDQILGNALLPGWWTTDAQYVATSELYELQAFSYWFTAPSVESPVRVKVGLTTLDNGLFGDTLYESDWRTLEADWQVHQIGGTPNVVLSNDHSYYAWVMFDYLIDGSAPWTVEEFANVDISGQHPIAMDGLHRLLPAFNSNPFVEQLPFDRELAMQAEVRPVPEPASLLVLMSGAAAFGLVRTARRRRTSPKSTCSSRCHAI